MRFSLATQSWSERSEGGRARAKKKKKFWVHGFVYERTSDGCARRHLKSRKRFVFVKPESLNHRFVAPQQVGDLKGQNPFSTTSYGRSDSHTTSTLDLRAIFINRISHRIASCSCVTLTHGSEGINQINQNTIGLCARWREWRLR